MRVQGKLSPENEAIIQREINNASLYLKIPSSILWCLFFQESRLNHLAGIDKYGASHGLGQFTYFSFYEINHQLERFSQDNQLFMRSLFGRDIRPIQPDRKDINNYSSYYSIPTAVMASSIYLNNRYHHLRRILERRNIEYHPDLLWMYAIAAYNKGTRSVISLWNETRRRRGTSAVERIVQDKDMFLQAAFDYPLLRTVLKRIWPAPTAANYAKELHTHLKNISACSLSHKILGQGPATQANELGSKHD